MKIAYGLTLLGLLVGSAAATAQTAGGPQPGGAQFYGNINIVGSGGCSLVRGLFPATASYTTAAVGPTTVTTFYLKIQIQNSTLTPPLPLQYVESVISKTQGANSGNEISYDPQLLGSPGGDPGTWSGPIGFVSLPSISALQIGSSLSSATFVLSSSGCTLALTGLLYFSPD